MEIELSQAEENYIKGIYSLFVLLRKPVSTNLIAEKLQTKASSVTDMIKKLSEKNLLHYVKYQGVTLSEVGEQIAVQIIRKHRLWETFLVNHLHFRWDEVHDVAEQLEHVQSVKLIDKLDEFLNFPTHDPHGDPIPDKFGNVEDYRSTLLSMLPVKTTAKIVGVKDSGSEFLKYLNKVGIHLGVVVSIVEIEAFDNSMKITLENKECLISNVIAANLYVKVKR